MKIKKNITHFTLLRSLLLLNPTKPVSRSETDHGLMAFKRSMFIRKVPAWIWSLPIGILVETTGFVIIKNTHGSIELFSRKPHQSFMLKEDSIGLFLNITPRTMLLTLLALLGLLMTLIMAAFYLLAHLFY